MYADNLSAIRNFYGEVISLKIISEKPEEITFQAGETELVFKISSNSKTPFYHFAFNIPSNKIEEAKLWMKGKADLLPISEDNYIADFENWKAKAVYFYDTLGNIVEFIARFDLKNDKDEKFNAAQILSVSEIGIVTKDVKALTQKLINEYKVSDFKKSTNSDTFAAMGDDNGLFIVAIENRNWYPTKLQSQIAPFEIEFINDEGERHIIINSSTS